jgi:hypothetical protein
VLLNDRERGCGLIVSGRGSRAAPIAAKEVASVARFYTDDYSRRRPDDVDCFLLGEGRLLTRVCAEVPLRFR